MSPNQPDYFMSKNRFHAIKNRIGDITKSWRFFGITVFFSTYISQNRFFKKNQVYLLISQNRFCDIKNRFGYIKFDFMISQSGDFIVHTGLFQDINL